jgi:hypothetical protein
MIFSELTSEQSLPDLAKSCSLNSSRRIISELAEKLVMDTSERRVISSLLLLSSLTFLTIGLYTEQLRFVLQIVKKIFEAAVAGLP